MTIKRWVSQPARPVDDQGELLGYELPVFTQKQVEEAFEFLHQRYVATVGATPGGHFSPAFCTVKIDPVTGRPEIEVGP